MRSLLTSRYDEGTDTPYPFGACIRDSQGGEDVGLRVVVSQTSVECRGEGGPAGERKGQPV